MLKRAQQPKDQLCPHCGGLFTKGGGFTRHRNACGSYKAEVQSDMAYRRAAQGQDTEEAGSSANNLSIPYAVPELSGVDIGGDDSNGFTETGLAYGEATAFASGAPTGIHGIGPPSEAHEPRLDDFRTEYHPKASRPTRVDHFEDYGRSEYQPPSKPPISNPWTPFRTRLDFELADLILNAALNRQQITTLISIIHQSREQKDGEGVTLNSYKDLSDTWDRASKKSADFDKVTISALYKGVPQTYDAHFRPLWKWALGLVDHPRLAPQFTWDAEQISKFNGEKWVRIFHEPWTGDDWWSIQSQLPTGASPLLFSVYADKTKLSNFGTEKGYPVVVQIVNLPVHLRNGNGIGSGQVVGWLPIVQNIAAEAGKTGFVNHKATVWHASFVEFLKEAVAYSKTGYHHTCGDDVLRWLFPIILILAADYEEQCIMALIRGLKGLHACPKCFIPSAVLSDLSQHYPLRTAAGTKELLDEAAELSSERREELMKQNGLRYVPNAFHDMKYTDINRALSFDRLHTSHSGLVGDHLIPQLKLHITELDRKACTAIDANVDAVPRWRNLYHFGSIMQVSFTDGSKHEDMAKLIVFAAHSVLTKERSPLGYLLLRCLRRFLVMDLYAALEVHTEETIAKSREAVKDFGSLLKEYIDKAEKEEFGNKNWNFIKAHLPDHLFDDIVGKGASRNFTTKPFEKLHGPLKNAYKDQTNFKEVAEQILKVEHRNSIARLIRNDIQFLDEFNGKPIEVNDNEPDDMEDFSTFSFGSRQPQCTFAKLSETNGKDVAFTNFRVRLNNFLSTELGRSVQLKPSDMLQEYRFLKVTYESQVDWRPAKDYLRCNPSFHNHPRYDFIMYKSSNHLIFAQLAMLFQCHLDPNHPPFSIALVHPYDEDIPYTDRPEKDKDLGLLRYRSWHRRDCKFIRADQIIRGALLAQDPEVVDERFVIDIVDTDMFLRLRHLHPEEPN